MTTKPAFNPVLLDIPDHIGTERLLLRAPRPGDGALQERLLNQEVSLLDPYAATDPAEFFAVCSEAFFKQPQRMAFEHPALYGELRGYYRVDPAGW